MQRLPIEDKSFSPPVDAVEVAAGGGGLALGWRKGKPARWRAAAAEAFFVISVGVEVFEVVVLGGH